jgi:molecular chaperone DnaK
MGAKLLSQCEQAKIALSDDQKTEHRLVVRDYLRAMGPTASLLAALTRSELESVVQPLVQQGLKLIDRLLEDARLDYASIECCLPTGGMVNMPAIRHGLVERFGGRVPLLPNGDRIISEGAAWIAHDGTQLTLSKPIEVRVADGSFEGRYHVLVPASFTLPVENQTRPVTNEQFVCADPRNGVAVFEFAKTRGVNQVNVGAERETLGEVVLPVDSNARPLLERLSCRLSIDSDYIAHVELHSLGRDARVTAEFHRLDFGLALPYRSDGSKDDQGGRNSERKPEGQSGGRQGGPSIAFRVNVATAEDTDNRRVVSGDLAYDLWPAMFDVRVHEASPRQREEQMYYRSCSYCSRSAYDISRNGRADACTESCSLPALLPASTALPRPPAA